jgi:hypothetical protein
MLYILEKFPPYSWIKIWGRVWAVQPFETVSNNKREANVKLGYDSPLIVHGSNRQQLDPVANPFCQVRREET